MMYGNKKISVLSYKQEGDRTEVIFIDEEEYLKYLDLEIENARKERYQQEAKIRKHYEEIRNVDKEEILRRRTEDMKRMEEDYNRKLEDIARSYEQNLSQEDAKYRQKIALIRTYKDIKLTGLT